MGDPTATAPGPVHLLTHEFRPFTGGIGVYVEETARALAQAGAEVTVWAPDYGRPAADQLPFPVRRLPMRGRQDWPCRLRLAGGLRAAFPGGRIPGTVVLAEPGPIRLWMYQGWIRLPKPDRLVVILHGSEIHGLPRLPHRRFLLRRLLRAADRIGAVSGAVADSAALLCPEAAGRLVRVPGAVRSAWQALPPVERDPAARPAEILQVGRLHPRKGQDLLLQAVALLPPGLHASIRVRLVGPVSRPAYAARLARFARAHGLPVSFEGAIPEAALQLAYASAAVLAMPSRPFRASVEGLGLALLEAQHFGCPVVAARTGGTAEALQDQRSGLLVPPADPPALAAALQALLGDPARARAMGRAGAAFVRQAFSWEANRRRLELG